MNWRRVPEAVLICEAVLVDHHGVDAMDVCGVGCDYDDDDDDDDDGADSGADGIGDEEDVPGVGGDGDDDEDGESAA